MKRIKTIENSINDLREARLGISQMSDIYGGKKDKSHHCFGLDQFMINDYCFCNKRRFI